MTSFTFPNQTSFYKGKVRDVYNIDNTYVVMIASDRISAFDVILPIEIPHKGQVLNQLAQYMLDATKDICSNWFLESPLPNVTIGRLCQPIKIEMVVRGNLAGHAWRTYKNGGRVLCGEKLPEGLKENDFLPKPIITPTTKADKGHDLDISKEEILTLGLVTEEEWETISSIALKLFERGNEIAKKRGLILVDTKYEFGMIGDNVYLIDEVHTPDSSRYFYLDGFEERQKEGIPQKQLSKEFVREWLIENGFMGLANQQIPVLTQEWAENVSKRYIELYENLTNQKFIPAHKMQETETYSFICDSLLTLKTNPS